MELKSGSNFSLAGFFKKIGRIYESGGAAGEIGLC